jgi:hypothetical protein
MNPVQLFLYEMKIVELKRLHKSYDNIDFKNFKNKYFKVNNKILKWRYLLKIFNYNKDLINRFLKDQNRIELCNKLKRLLLK